MKYSMKEVYRKLKGSVYYDKSLPYVKTRLAEFEGKNIGEKLERFQAAFESGDEWEELEKRIINSIQVLTFPKKIEDYKEQQTDEVQIISNIHAAKTSVSQYNNFIDMCVEGYLAGILWIIEVGVAIDKKTEPTSYGNRLRENLILGAGEITASPNLFKPYFEQYETWRNEGLEKAQKYLEEGQGSVVITMLDLSRYYYSADFSRDMFYKFTGHENLDEKGKRINDTVLKILEKYSNMCCMDHIILPIGFHPSNILANVYLLDLDKKIKEIPGTLYYGRYVDDMMWVKSIPDDRALVEEIRRNGNKAVSVRIIDELLSNNIIKKEQDDFVVCGKKLLTIKKEKMRFFFLSKEGSKNLISDIERDIRNNSSEFNFIPEENFDEEISRLFEIKRTGTVNKISGITSVTLDKYALSKSIGKRVMMSAFEEEKQVENFTEELKQILDSKEIVTNYLLWENVLNYFIVNRKLSDTIEFTAKVVDAIVNLDEDSNKIEEFSYLKGNENICGVKKSLIYFYRSCLVRSFANVWGKEVQSVLREVVSLLRHSDFERDIDVRWFVTMRENYITSKMNNKSILPVTMKTISMIYDFEDEGETCYLSDFEDILKKPIKKQDDWDYEYMPYINAPQEIGFSLLVEQLKRRKSKLKKQKDYLECVGAEYRRNFPEVEKDFLEEIFKIEKERVIVKTDAADYVKTAVANVHTSEAELNKILEGKRVRNAKRAAEITEMANEAIRKNVDVLVLPEAYVPLRYVPLLSKKSAQKQMLIVCGVEHIVISKRVWNLNCVIIPFETNGIKCAIPFFRQKKYFSPEEKKKVEGKGFKIPRSTENTLFRWREFNFAVYCCYELTDINYRSEFRSDVETIYAVEFNKDIKYFSNIAESMSRDLYCYFVQANVSEYGDSRIVAPMHGYEKNRVRVKAENATVLIGTVDLRNLREAKGDPAKRGQNRFTELPAGFDV